MGKRDRTRAFITEFIIVVLFFSIASVLTVQLFVAASAKSNEARAVTNAGIAIESTIENILALESADDIKEDNEYTRYFDSQWNETTEEKSKYILTVENEFTSSEAGSLLSGKVNVYGEETTVISTSYSKYFKNRGSDND